MPGNSPIRKARLEPPTLPARFINCEPLLARDLAREVLGLADEYGLEYWVALGFWERFGNLGSIRHLVLNSANFASSKLLISGSTLYPVSKEVPYSRVCKPQGLHKVSDTAMAINSIRILSDTGFLNRERRSKFLLVSILLFFVMAPLIEDREIGGLFLILNLYATLAASTMELAGNRILFWSAIPIACVSMFLLLFSHFVRIPALLVANSIVLALFFLLVSVSLFAHLGKSSPLTNSKLFVSVSLYFMLGLTWFAIYHALNLVQPGSFTEAGNPISGDTHWSTFLYFSLTTLTTLGYGDILAVKPAARMFAVLEAVSGVLYIAITVSRLVSAGKERDRQQS